MIKGILFDMDGVLVDNMAAHAEAFERFCEEFGCENVTERLYKCAGMGNDEIMDIMLPAEVVAERGKAALSAEKEAIYRELYADKIVPVAGLVEMLKELKTKGVSCAVGSSGCKENVEFVVERCKLREYFDGYVYSDLVTRCKPDPEIYLTAAKQLGLEPWECVVFEDALVGIESARRAGVAKVIALTTTISAEELRSKSDADIIVDDFRTCISDMSWLDFAK
ncbi:MAG: HAD family phosphatase [Rikenellaceae bacterium]